MHKDRLTGARGLDDAEMKTQDDMRREFWRNKYGCEPPAQTNRSRPTPNVVLVGALPSWTLSRRIEENGRSFFEQITPTAFRDSIEARDNVTLELGHGGQDLASVRDGTLTLFDSAEGLKFRATVPANDGVLRLLDHDRVGVSPTMRVTPSGETWTEAGGTVRTITKASLIHLAITDNPAYSTAWIGREGTVMRSLKRVDPLDAKTSAMAREAFLQVTADQLGFARYTDAELRIQKHREMAAAIWRQNNRTSPPLG